MIATKLVFLVVLAYASAGVPTLDYNCPTSGQKFFRYPYDCTKFIECNNGAATVQDCIMGLHFSESLSYCDFPDSVNCVAEQIPAAPEGCPETNGEFAVFLADITNCNRYYECDWGKPILMDCPEGLYFNHELDVCDYPENSGCVQK